MFQAEDGIRDLVRSRGLGDVYKRQLLTDSGSIFVQIGDENVHRVRAVMDEVFGDVNCVCLLYTSDAADERSSVDLGGRRIIKKKNR